jgi:hypothetical protein
MKVFEKTYELVKGDTIRMLKHGHQQYFYTHEGRTKKVKFIVEIEEVDASSE